jgi:MFS family permease
MSFGFIFMAYSGALPVLMQDWAMSAGQAGLIHSGWQVGYLLSLFAVGFLSDRLGAKRTFLMTSVAACISAWVFAAFANGFLSGLLLFSLTGLCSGGSYTPGLTLIAERFPPERRGGAMGWYLAASSAGYALSLLLGSQLIADFGWRWGFFAAASGPVIGAVIAFRVLRTTPNVVLQRHAERGGLQRLSEVWRNRPAMLAIWSYAFHAWELLGLWAWLPAYLAAAVAMHYGPSEAVTLGLMLSGLSFATNTLGSVAAGRLSDRLGRTSIMLALSLTSIACSLVFGWLVMTPMWVVTAVAIGYNLTALGDSSVYSTALTELIPQRLLGVAYSLRSALGFGMGAISPLVFGVVLDLFTHVTNQRGTVAWGMAWLTLGIGALAGPVAILRLRRIPGSHALDTRAQ